MVSTTEWRLPFGSVRVIRSPTCSGPSRTPDNWSCSAIADTEESQLHSWTIGAVAHLTPAPQVYILVGLADRQHNQIHRRLLLQRRQLLSRNIALGGGPE